MNIKNTIHLLANYGLATFATAAVSGSHLLVQLGVLHSLGSAEFGLVAFMLTLMQFGAGLCNAVVAGPFTVMLHQGSSGEGSVDSFFAINTLLALANAALAIFVSLTVGSATWPVALLFGLTSALFTIRWFGRTQAYVTHRPIKAAMSDVIYSVVLLAGLAIGWFSGFSLLFAAAIFAVAGIVGTAPFGTLFMLGHLIPDWRSAFSAYRSIWRTQSRWAVLGLVTTEATSNAHSYMVTSIAGPAAFAPIAAAMLFLRPIGVCMVSLTQLERPAMARALANGDRRSALRYAARFMTVLLLMWLATLVAVAGILHFFPGLAFKPGLDANLVVVAFALWAAVCFVQCVQTPLNVFLQAEGRFRELANASIRSSVVTLAAVPLLLATIGPVYSTLGVLVGQIIMTLGIVMYVRRSRNVSDLRAPAEVSA